MSHRVVHLVHLTPTGLRWASLEGGARRELRLACRGEAEGDPQALLDEWFGRHARREDPIFLYDARPMYYRIRVAIPRAPGASATGSSGSRSARNWGSATRRSIAARASSPPAGTN